MDKGIGECLSVAALGARERFFCCEGRALPADGVRDKGLSPDLVLARVPIRSSVNIPVCRMA